MMPTVPTQAERVLQSLAELYPDAKCALTHANAVQLLVATILSAQCTDARVNMVTPALFEEFPTAADFANANLKRLQKLIASTGFFRNKAKNIKACCQIIVEKHGGEVPNTLDELVQLPGVGRKTANVVLGDVFGVPGITVDTHVGRLSRRLGLTVETDAVKAEFDLMAIIPQPEWTRFSHRLIFHGRQVCHARKPSCDTCTMASFCPKIDVGTPKKKPTKAVTSATKRVKKKRAGR